MTAGSPRLALLPLALLAGVALAACSSDSEDVDRGALHAQIVEALDSKEIRHLRYTFQEFPEAPVEQHELWIDWRNQRARLERRFPGSPLIVTVVADGLIHEGTDPPRSFADAGFEDRFDQAAIPATHLFQWLLQPNEAFRDPVRHLPDAKEGVEHYGWTTAWETSDSGVCAVVSLELDAVTSLPLRSSAEACPELGERDGRGFVTEYETIDAVSRTAVGPDIFVPLSAATNPDSASPARPTPTPVLATSVVGEHAIDGFELLVLSIPYDDRFPSDQFADRLDRVYRNAAGEIVVDVLVTASDLGAPTFQSGFAIDPSGQEIVVAVCGLGDCGGFTPPEPGAMLALHRSTDGGRTWASYGEIEAGSWIVGWSAGEVVVREPPTGNDPDSAARYYLYPSRSALVPPREGRAPASPRIIPTSGELLWASDDGRSLLNDAGLTMRRFPTVQNTSSLSEAQLSGDASFLSWQRGAAPVPVSAALFDRQGNQLTTTLAVPYDCCQLAIDSDRILISEVRPFPEWVETYRDELPLMQDGRPYPRSVPGVLDPRTGTIEAITDPFLRAAYQDRDQIRILAIVPSATPNVAAPDTSWRELLEATPGLVELVDTVVAGPEGVLQEATTVQALCSFHGELFELCAERGLTVTDRFEAVVVTIGLFCEACEVPPARLETALRGIYERGGVPTEAFWSGSAGTNGAAEAGAGVELVGVWTLDDATIAHITERWEGNLAATHALGFRARRPQPGFEVITGFLLFVDPSQPRPIAILDPTNEAWTSFDAARALGGWQILYEKP